MRRRTKAIIAIAVVLLALVAFLSVNYIAKYIYELETKVEESKPAMAATVVYDGQSIQDGTTAEVLPSALQGTEYPGDYMRITVTEDSQEVPMVNDEDNLTYIDYAFYLDDVELCRTGLIAPGQMLNVNLYELLDKGDHVLNLVCQPYAIEDSSVAYTSFSMETQITVN